MKLFLTNHRYCRVLVRKNITAFISITVTARPPCGSCNRLVLLLLLCSSIGVGWGQTTYNLVTSTAGLLSGANYLIVNTTTNGTGYALGYQNTSNRPSATITVASNSISATAAITSADVTNPYQITLGGTTGAWTLYDAVTPGYLYAASNSSAMLKSNAAVKNWTISFLSNAAILTCTTGSYSYNTLQFNNTSKLFSSYQSTQSSVYLYQAASPNYYWNGSNTTAFNNTWNTTGTYWSQPTAATTLNAIWPTSAGIYNANFNSAAAATTITIPGTIAYTPNIVNIGTSNYTFATTGAVAGTLSSPINLNANGLTLAPISTANLILPGVIGGTGTLAINGGGTSIANGGTLQLQGANTYSGATTVGASVTNAAILQLDAGGTIATSSLTINNNSQLYLNTSGVTYSNTGTLTLNGNGNSANLGAIKLVNPSVGTVWNGAITLASNSGIAVAGATSTFKLGGVLSIGANTLTKTGVGTLILNNTNNTGSAGSSIAATSGTIQLGAANVVPDFTAIAVSGATFDVNGFGETIGSVSGSGTITNSTATPSVLTIAADNLSQSFTGIIAGGSNLSIIKTGTGTQTLSGTQTYTGGMTVNNGYLAITTENNLIGTTGNVVLNGGGVATTSALNINSSRGYSLGSNGGYLDATNGTITLTDALVFAGAATNSTLNVMGGTVQMASSNRIPISGSGMALNMNNTANAILDIAGTNQTFAALSGGGVAGGNVINSTGTATLTVGNTTGNASSTFAGIIGGGSINLVKQASGTLTLSGVNTFTGTTTINAGTLAITGSLSTGDAVTIAAGGTLAGTGTVAGSVAVYGAISPNAVGTIGTLTTGNLTLEPSGFCTIDINNVTGVSGTNWDKIVMGALTNSATAASKFTIAVNGTIAGFDINTMSSWIVGTYTGTAPSTDNILFTTSGTTAGLAVYFSVSFTGNNITLVYTPSYCATPTAQATNLIAGTATSLSVPVSFTGATSNPDGYLVIRTNTNIPPSNPVDASSYVVGTTALGGFVESASNLTFFTSSGLSPNTSYWYWVFSFNNTNCLGGPKYCTTTPLMGTVTTATPTILVSQLALNGLNYNVGSGPSGSQVYNLSASNLSTASGNITITGTTDYEVSKDNSSFSASQTVLFAGYSLASTPVYVRLKTGLAQGSYLGETIANSGGGAATVNVTSNGTVSSAQAGIALGQWDMSNLSGTIDTPFLTTSPSPAGVIISGLTRGNNVGTSAGIFRGWGGIGWSTNTTDPGVATGVNVYFTVQVATGYVASISSIPQFSYRRSATGPSTGSLYYQINTGTYALVGTSGSLSFSSSSSSGANILPIDLSGIVALQNLPGGTIVTFMIVPFNAYSGAGSWYIYDQAGSTASDFTLYGTTGGFPVMTSAVAANSIFGTATSFSLTASNSPSSFSASGLPTGMALNIATGVISILSTTAIGSYSITTSATNSYGTSSTTSLTYTVNANISNWVGTTADYNTASNWADNVVPASGAAIAIPSGVNYSPVLGTNAIVGNLEIGAGTVLDLNGQTLTINGVVSGSGTITSNESSDIILTGAAGTLYFTSASNSLKNLTLNTNATATLGTQLNIVGGFVPGTVSIESGATLNTGNNLVIKSDLNGTGRVAQVVGNITGNVTMERYITAKAARKYSYIGSSVVSSVRNSWQQQIYISGTGSGGVPCGLTSGDGGSTDKYNSNGFDATQNSSPSMYTYSPALINGSRYVGIANTELTNLSPGTGYILNIRGNRNSTTVSCANQLETGSPTAPEEVILSATGSVTTGDVSVALNDLAIHKYTLLANPYPSQISYAAFQASNANINNKMWTYSPFGNGNYSTYSAGVIANGAIGYDNTNGDYIASGEAFFVQANTNGTVQFHETDKINSTLPNTQYFGVVNTSLVRIGLRNSSNNLLDEVVVRFNNQGTSMYSAAWDAESLSSASQSLSIIKQGKALAIATFPDSITSDTIQLNVGSNVTGSYQLSFSDFDDLGTVALTDRFLNTNQNVRSNTSYNFNVTSDSASKGRNRFYAVISGIRPLPVNFSNISIIQDGKSVNVNWHISNEANIESYVVEKSNNGNSLVVVGRIKSIGIGNYTVVDANIPTNISKLYYRIKAIGTDGTCIYSPIAMLQLKPADCLLTIYPNPVKEELKFVYSSSELPIITLWITSAMGVEMMRVDHLEVKGNRVSVNIEGLAKGVYILEVLDKSGNKLRKKFIKA